MSHQRIGLLCLPLCAGLTAVGALAVPPLPAAEENIRNLAGCFEVSYKFVEDGAHDFTLPASVELITLEEKNGALHLQHEIVSDGARMKHWREEWTPEADSVWNQRVVGPFEDFRYECSARWEFRQWGCVAAGGAKPRRDEARPYATIDRGNTIQVNGQRWIHSQNNTKRLADGSAYSNEVGWVEYTRVGMDRCGVGAAAQPASAPGRAL